MTHKDNLLLNLPVYITLSNDAPMKIQIPSIKEMNEDLGYFTLGKLFNLDLSELNDNAELYGFKMDDLSIANLLIGVRMVDELKSALDLLSSIANLEVTKNGVFHDEYELNDEELEEFVEIYLTGTMQKVKTEAKPKSKHEERIAKIRGKQKPKEEEEVDVEAVILLMMYELGYSRDEIISLNYYGFHKIAEIARKAPVDKISKLINGSGRVEFSYKNITEH